MVMMLLVCCFEVCSQLDASLGIQGFNLRKTFWLVSVAQTVKT